MRNILFSPPDVGDAEIEEIAKAVKSGWITTGPRTKQLEKEIAEYCEADHAVCLNSATACEEMALRVLGIGPGDEVIVPAYTYTATASPISHVNANIVMVDVAEDSFEMDYQALEKAITNKTKAIVGVDIGGIICDYNRIFEIVERNKNKFKPSNKLQKSIGRIAVLADSAHGLGASRNGKKSGSIADFTSFSFHAVKNFTTAEGGALTWNSFEDIDDDALYQEFMLLSLHGQSKDALAKNKIGAWEYDILSTAYKCNMTDIMAAMGLVQMKRYPGMLEKRRKIISAYDGAFKPMGMKVMHHFDETNESSGHLYLLRVPGIDERKRNEIIVKIAERGIATNVHYKPLPMMTAYKNMGFDIKNYPNAYKQYENEITLPLYSLLTDEDVNYIIENVVDVLKEYI